MTDFSITLEKTGPYELSYTYNMVMPCPGSDKVCLFVYNREMSYSASNPITEASGTGKFTVSSVGYYNVRIIRGSDTVHALARSEPVLIGPSVDLSVETDNENAIVTYSVNDDPAYPNLNGAWWIGAYRSGTLSNRTYVSSKYCSEKRSGEKVLFNRIRDLKLTKNARSVDFRFFFETDTPYKYSGATTFELLSRDSLSAIFSRGGGASGIDKSCELLTVYWERHEDTVGSWDFIGIYTPNYESGTKVAEKYLTEGTDNGNGSGNICFDLTEWYAKYRKTSTETPQFEICYFTHTSLIKTVVDDMSVKVDMNGNTIN